MAVLQKQKIVEYKIYNNIKIQFNNLIKYMINEIKFQFYYSSLTSFYVSSYQAYYQAFFYFLLNLNSGTTNNFLQNNYQKTMKAKRNVNINIQITHKLYLS